MMGTFEERELAFEAKFQHDEERRFKILARRARLFGLWAAEQMGMERGEAEAYAFGLVNGAVDFCDAGALIHHVCVDLKKAGVDVSNHRVERHAVECLAEAQRQYADL